MKLIDKFNRKINYLRISITDRCNFNCIYCNPKNLYSKLAHDDIITYEEILRLIKIGTDLGITKIRITGGEPFVRKGCAEFLQKLSKFEALKDIAVTTNAVFLKDNIDKIKNSPLKRLNISLDTLKKEKFEKIAGFDAFTKVWEGIMSAYEAGFSPIKINVVALKGINDDEFIDFAKLSFKYPFHIRFIELMPIGMQNKDVITGDYIKDKISGLGKLIPIKKDMNDGPAERYKFENALGEIGLICPISRHFCKTCNRMRLTANGYIRTCLLSDEKIDILKPLRNGASDKELADIILNAVLNKPIKHNLNLSVSDQMCAIGG
jgi:GTP 3',8-cyclase